MGSSRSGGIVFVGGHQLNIENRKEVTVTEFPDNQVALDVMIKGGTADGITVKSSEARPLNTKELKQLVDEDFPVTEIIPPPP